MLSQCWSKWAYNRLVFSRFFLFACLFIFFHGLSSSARLCVDAAIEPFSEL